MWTRRREGYARAPLARGGASGSRANTRRTCATCEPPPAGVTTPRALRATARPSGSLRRPPCRVAALASARVGEVRRNPWRVRCFRDPWDGARAETHSAGVGRRQGGIKRLTANSRQLAQRPGPLSLMDRRARSGVPLHREMRAVTEPASSSTVAPQSGGSATGGNAQKNMGKAAPPAPLPCLHGVGRAR
jgi:hypothetical protein